jgi:hypothetical protein
MEAVLLSAFAITINFFKTNIIPISSFFVASASFCVSWLSFKRDSGRLDVSIYLAEVRDGTTLKLEQNGLQIKIVNSGRRPLTVSSIGGDHKGQLFQRVASKILGYRTPQFLKQTAFVLQDDLVTSALTKDGQYKTLLEGNSISIFLPFPKGSDLVGYIAKKCSSFYVFDSIGRKHRAPKAALKKIQYDFQKSDPKALPPN